MTLMTASKIHLSFLSIFAALLMCAPVFCATVDVTTLYDYPDGDFRDLTVSGNVDLATAGGNVLMGMGGGFVSIGTTTAGPQTLLVKGNLNNQITASMVDAGGNGINVGGFVLGGVAQTYGVLQGRAAGNLETLLNLNPNGSSVAIGPNYAVATAPLQISGTLGITQLGNTGEVKVALADNGGPNQGYYATYGA